MKNMETEIVLFLGDSITRHYYPFAEKNYKSKINNYLKCSDSDLGRIEKKIDLYKILNSTVLAISIPESDSSPRSVYEAIFCGCAIATSYVGLVHPFSAGLSVTFGTHHCLANCISMRSMEEFYPEHFAEFFIMAEKQAVEIPTGLCTNLNNEQYEKLFQSTIIHEKPLVNALGTRFKEILTKARVKEIFMRM